MRIYYIFCIIIIYSAIHITNTSIGQDGGITNTGSSPYVKLRNIDITDCQWTEGFWAERFNQVERVGLESLWATLKNPALGHAWQNFQKAAGVEKGGYKGSWWQDGDFYKSIEATAYVYAKTKNPELDKLMDEAIDLIARAQRNDGYIHTPHIIGYGVQGPRDSPFQDIGEPLEVRTHHELYCMGHLITAACIHYRLTDKNNFLNVAIKTADYLYTVFQPRPAQLVHAGWNPAQIMALAELYRTTGNKKYLDLTKTFIDMRGAAPGGSDHNQYRVPLRKEDQAVGHVVTGNYLWAGAADLYAETGEDSLMMALDNIWKDIVETKTFVTGGNGQRHHYYTERGDMSRETYAGHYEMPNAESYNETCGNISNAMFNMRMLGIKGEAKYADVAERVLYNTTLSATDLSCTRFFYSNPLRKHEGHHVKEVDSTRWVNLFCFCCPPNVLRTIVKSSGWSYSKSENALWVNLYGANKLNTRLADGTEISLTQKTNYPWEGTIKIKIEKSTNKEVDLMLRIPGWSNGGTITVNGKGYTTDISPGKFAKVRSKWKKGDEIILDLPMPVTKLRSHPRIEETRNEVAIQRGPVVYCIESADLPLGTSVMDIAIPADFDPKVSYRDDFLNGIVMLEGNATLLPAQNWQGKMYQELNTSTSNIQIKLIPYYAWANRGIKEMTVWMPLIW